MGRVSTALSRLRARTRGDLGDEVGFTLIEMIVAMTILAVSLITVAYGLFGGMRVLQAGRHKTTFLELANAEAESLRALDYEAAGVNSDDPDLSTAYTPSGSSYLHDGRLAVVIDPPSALTPPAVETVTSTTLNNVPTPYKIRRWITWTDTAAGNTPRFKKIDVTLEWNEANGQPRSVSYSTLYYPGNLGPVNTPPPVGAFSVSPGSGFRSSTSFAVDASASTDPTGLAMTYAWDFGDGTTGVGVTANHTYATVGRKTITLIVTNIDGVSSTPVTQNVLVGTAPGVPAPPGNVPPVGAFLVTPTSGPGPLSVTVDASATTDVNGDPLTYRWDWGDGTPVGAGVTAGHVYPNPGNYTITLTATDPAGTSGVAAANVSVTSVNCAVTAASFKNPPSNAENNAIDIRNNGRPENSNFSFSAVTNSACTGVTARIPTQTGSFNATLGLLSAVGNTKTWGVSASDSSKYSTGNSQSATFTATWSGANVPFTVSFRVYQ